MVLITSKESMVAALIVNPNFDVTNPKVIKTIGEIIITGKSHIVNLFSLLAQTALIELAKRAIKTAPII